MRTRGPVPASPIALVAILVSAGCAGDSGPNPGWTIPPSSRGLQCVDVDGRAHEPLQSPRGRVQVFFVTSHECPIANAYAPTIASLAKMWADQAVQTWVIQADPDLTAAAAGRHAEEYALPRPVLLDPRHELIHALGATMTPEAVVVRDDRVLYRGRVDDRWRELGMRARETATHDLRDAVAAVCENRDVAERRTPVIGCHLPEPRR